MIPPALAAELARQGWLRFAGDDASRAWAEAAARAAEGVLADPEMRAQWLHCEGTWFVGVDALPSDAAGAVAGVPLAGAAIPRMGRLPDLHPAQLSVVYPGYPRPRAGESDAAFRYRRDRAAAHVDGITRDETGARHVTEPHAWILGIGLGEAAPEAAPLTIWEGSHHVISEALGPILRDGGTCVTEAYVAARKTCFERCARRALPLAKGEMVLLHRLLLHGIGTWAGPETRPRATAYFRPLMGQDLHQWVRVDGNVS